MIKTWQTLNQNYLMNELDRVRQMLEIKNWLEGNN